MTERLDQTTDRVDGQRPHADERRACPDKEQVGLGTAVPMGDGTQNGRVHTSVTGQFLGIRLVILAITRRDGPQFPGIGYENLVTELRQQLRHPRRMRAGFDRDPSRGEGLETLREAARSTLEAAFLEDLALGIQKAELAPAIPQIDADRERGNGGFRASSRLGRNGNHVVHRWSPYHQSLAEQTLCCFRKPGISSHLRQSGIPESATHLHNMHTASESDGFPGDYVTSGYYRDSHYTMC